MGAEIFALRLEGGPFAGTRQSRGPWPLPDELPDPELRGTYIKVAESQLTEPHPNVMRGAQYEWRPAPQTEA